MAWPFLSIARGRGLSPTKRSWLSSFLVCVHLEGVQLRRERQTVEILYFNLRLSSRSNGVIIFLNLCVLTM